MSVYPSLTIKIISRHHDYISHIREYVHIIMYSAILNSQMHGLSELQEKCTKTIQDV